jgi:superfamily II DNA or RNA helicase
MELGIYESLITTSLKQKLGSLDASKYYIADDKKLDAEEASQYLGRHLSEVILSALKLIKGEKQGLSLLEKQIEITNKLMLFLAKEIEAYDFKDDLLDAQGHILEGVFDKLNSDYVDLKLRLSEIMPSTRLTQSELFTGGNVGISLESELKKEIRSADRVDLLVSFIKWKAIVILREALEEFTARGGKLRVITTTYMGATDAKAIEELSKLPNTEIKVSYNTSNERLHAKAYLFYRNTGFHTGYIGSSNFSRSALTDGLEWNVKVTTKEIPHIIDKFKKTFESYWAISEFETYHTGDYIKLSKALKDNHLGKKSTDITTFFNLKPYHYQLEILEKLKVERQVHGSMRNLVVAATGTGKTMLAAFDFKHFKSTHPNAKMLFLAHRIEILEQAMKTFRQVLLDANFGELLGNGHMPGQKNAVFATIQTFNNLDLPSFCSPTYYDYIVIDEVHHAQADSYQKVIKYFQPQLLLGLTATPERMDGGDILVDFNYRIAAEIRLPDALNNKLLCPFQYFGITDSIDYSRIKWDKGRYNNEELTNVLTASDVRVRDIMFNLNKYTKDPHSVSCIGFCASKAHAVYMADKFNQVGYKAAWLNADNSSSRHGVLAAFKKKELQYLFVVDMFNEGVDIPQIDTVLFLRPTESLTIFLQQLGRGLRLHEGKDVLTVLDFVGQAREEYDFENKFRSLIGKTNTTVAHEIERDFPNLPLGSSIVLEKKAKEYILENIRRATKLDKRQLIKRLINYKNHTDSPLTLKNFLKIYNLTLADIYKNNSFYELKAEAFKNSINTYNAEKYKSMLSKKWIVTESLSYFQFILRLRNNQFDISTMPLSEQEQTFALMFYYDFYQEQKLGGSLVLALREIGKNKDLVAEMLEFIEVKIDQLSFEEIPCLTPANFPLAIHARYTREQILVALGLSTYEKQSSNREGVALNKDTNTEALFINLRKSEEDFSPTTMYEDYAINETLFHWQSQNQTSATSEKGRSYIEQIKLGKNILLFVRESKQDANKFTQGYVFLGPANFVEYEGSKPMSIKWELREPIPNYIWKESAKMLVG